MRVEVRPAALSDEEALWAIDRATWNSLTSPAPLPPPERTFFREKTHPDDVLVATVDGEVAGYVKLEHPTPLAASAHVLKITGISVDPARQRQGVGRALIEKAIADARSRGARRLTLLVLGPNVAARRLYDSAGFVVEGIQRDEFFLDGAYVDDISMAFDLTAAVS